MSTTLYQPGDMIEIQVIGRIYGEECMNVLHFALEGSPKLGMEIATEMNAVWINSLRVVYTVDWKWLVYKMRRVSPGDPSNYETWPSSMQVGLGGGGAFPLQISNLWGVRTADASPIRPLRGRIYHPAVPGTAWIQGNWASAYANTNAGRMTTIAALICQGGTSFLKLMVRSNDGGASPATGFLWRSQPAVIRSRRPAI